MEVGGWLVDTLCAPDQNNFVSFDNSYSPEKRNY